MSSIVTSFSALFQPKSVRLIQSTTGGNAEAYAYSYTRAEHISWSVKAFVCVYTRGEKGINLWARPLVQNAAERKNKLWYYDGWAGKKKVKKKKKAGIYEYHEGGLGFCPRCGVPSFSSRRGLNYWQSVVLPLLAVDLHRVLLTRIRTLMRSYYGIDGYRTSTTIIIITIILVTIIIPGNNYRNRYYRCRMPIKTNLSRDTVCALVFYYGRSITTASRNLGDSFRIALNSKRHTMSEHRKILSGSEWSPFSFCFVRRFSRMTHAAHII